MPNTNSIILFDQIQVRRYWDSEQEVWYFSVVDVVETLTNSSIPRRYRSDLKWKLKQEWSEVYEKIVQLKMTAPDGKQRETDCFSTEDMLRVIQSIPSPKAEPFKLWLAKVGYERIEEMENPELAFDRAMQTYLKKWYSPNRINQRIKSIEIRKELTDERKERGIQEWLEYAILTDEITQARADKSVKQYKEFKWLKKQNLRDNMSNLELVLSMLAEASTTEISKKQQPRGLEANKKVAKEWWNVAKQARKTLEQQTGESIISSQNAHDIQDSLHLLD